MLSTGDRIGSEPASADRYALLGALGKLVTRRPVMCVVTAVLVTILAGVFQSDLTSRLSGGGFTPQSAESALAERLLSSAVRGGRPNLVLITPYKYSLPDLKTASALHQRIADSPEVAWVQSYWDSQDPDLSSTDKRFVAVLVRLNGDERTTEQEAVKLVPEWEKFSGWKLYATGEAEANAEGVIQSEKDLIYSELIGIPLAILILWPILGGFLAVLLPFAVSVGAVLTACAFLRILTYFVEVSTFGMSIMTALGL